MDNLESEIPAPGEVDVNALIRAGHLPRACGLHPTTGVPVWTFAGLAQMFRLSPLELARELVRRGAVHEA